MHQRIGMEGFYRGPSIDRLLLSCAHQPGTLNHQKPAQAFAARHRMAHALSDWQIT